MRRARACASERVKSSEKRGPWSVALFVLHLQGEELTKLSSALQSIDRPWQPTRRMLAHRIVWPQLPEEENQVSVVQLNWIERGFYGDGAVFQNSE
jgi:hypothetical protein